MKLELALPWVLCATLGSVVVRDAHGMPFYVMEGRSPNALFTLPSGTYTIEGDVVPLRPMDPKPEPILPPPLVAMPANVRVEYGHNPHKCSINLERGRILMDRSMLALPSFVRTFILFHEIGHYYHNDEAECDKFAADAMIAAGFNPTQVHMASRMSLSDNADHRKNSTYQYLAR